MRMRRRWSLIAKKQRQTVEQYPQNVVEHELVTVEIHGNRKEETKEICLKNWVNSL